MADTHVYIKDINAVNKMYEELNSKSKGLINLTNQIYELSRALAREKDRILHDKTNDSSSHVQSLQLIDRCLREMERFERAWDCHNSNSPLYVYQKLMNECSGRSIRITDTLKEYCHTSIPLGCSISPNYTKNAERNKETMHLISHVDFITRHQIIDKDRQFKNNPSMRKKEDCSRCPRCGRPKGHCSCSVINK